MHICWSCLCLFFFIFQIRLMMKVHAFVRENAVKVLNYKKGTDIFLSLVVFSGPGSIILSVQTFLNLLNAVKSSLFMGVQCLLSRFHRLPLPTNLRLHKRLTVLHCNATNQLPTKITSPLTSKILTIPNFSLPRIRMVACF